MRAVLTTRLQAVDASIMLAIPPALLEQLSLCASDMGSLSLGSKSSMVERLSKPNYSLEELMATSNFTASVSADEAALMSLPAFGRELL